MTTEQKIGKFLAAVVVLAVMPLAYMWSWNQLFSQFYTFEYTFWNWAAVAILTRTIKLTVK